MFPYQWGGEAFTTPMGMVIGTNMLDLSDPRMRDLPEDVRQALEEREDEIHGEGDIRRLINELMLRR